MNRFPPSVNYKTEFRLSAKQFESSVASGHHNRDLKGDEKGLTAIRITTRLFIDPCPGGGRNESAVRMAAFSTFGDTTAVRCMLQLAANNGDTCTGVRFRPPAQIIRGVTPHKNIQRECNVTIWNFYDLGFFMHEIFSRMETL